MTDRILEDWKILPLHGGGVTATGKIGGAEWRTTKVVNTRPGQIRTESGSVYTLGAQNTGMWMMQLQVKRPAEYANLQKQGIL